MIKIIIEYLLAEKETIFHMCVCVCICLCMCVCVCIHALLYTSIKFIEIIGGLILSSVNTKKLLK